MIAVSVVIITYNEALNIARCIESVQKIADDIVVLDSFSSDTTEVICRTYPKVRFFQHAFDGHIQQKNRAITYALYPHVLSLDADEALSEELQQAIIDVKSNWQYDGYSFNRLTNYCGKWIRHCGWYPDTKLRLWDSRKGAWGGKNPHDTYLMHTATRTAKLSGDLLHYSFYTIDQHITQINKFSVIAAKTAFEEGKRSSILKILIKPAWMFFYSYIVRLGFLDGYYGWVVCVNSAHAKFLKYSMLYQLQQKS